MDSEVSIAPNEDTRDCISTLWLDSQAGSVRPRTERAPTDAHHVPHTVRNRESVHVLFVRVARFAQTAAILEKNSRMRALVYRGPGRPSLGLFQGVGFAMRRGLKEFGARARLRQSLRIEHAVLIVTTAIVSSRR